ncbi:hypothetical protein UY3_14721 [Chelonia mydas]|uniref:Uncharacterized protein n=1 Tax=Chelonia mydas TaxID=8469 RepID=M7AS44_CHEMY|nr:hypothetical protein UY3_14721 [Chelonia mydas]
MGESQSYCRRSCGTATLTSVRLQVAALLSDLGSWRAAAAGREPSSEGRAIASSSAETHNKFRTVVRTLLEIQPVVCGPLP